ncbi:transposase [Burkholderia vietnamiensis]|uniref:transposase n=1 Tax=Burkholderia vietnamiensis TaxID=60552 RepID=UPI0007532939|nr:transposase [Burkholderia vietnamiensis]MBR8085545.1 transposase [Burkholderia vietnamiensis]MDN7820222.1 transposase [Burkholderia vietnamiensis]UEC05283.1 transposase [Burkholderia vietnamiensis]
MTNLFDAVRFPAAIIGDLYHQRWRIEEAFKRIKHRLALEHVTGLSQVAVAQDLAAKILCDNIHSLLSQAAHATAELPRERRINRTFAVTAIRPLLPLLLLGRATTRQLTDALALLARRTYVHRPAKTQPRPSRPKPHKFMAMKTC